MLRLVKFLAFFLVALLAMVAVFPLLPPWKGWYSTRAVLTGSMETVIPKGAVILNSWREDRNLKIGDIITYRKPDQKDFYITHRIVKIEKKGALYFFQTKGDRVSFPDPWKINQSLIEGKVIFVIPLLGYLYAFIQSPLGLVFLVFLPAGWLIFEEIKNIRKELKKQKTEKQKNIKILIPLFILVSFFNQLLPAYAYFSSAQVTMDGIDLSVACNPLSSSIVALADYQKQANFNLAFSACDDLSKIQELKLYYARDPYGSWVYFDHQFPNTNPATGSFSFNSPLGDGYYRFLAVAIDELGNAEYDLNNLDFLPANTWTVVDTAAPITALSVNHSLAIANDQIYNGGFENGNLDGWTTAGDGNHQATQAAVKSGAWSALLGKATSDSLSKNLTLAPEITSTLSFWYRLLTNDVVGEGFFNVTVKKESDEIKIVHDGWDDITIDETDLGWKNVVYQLNNLVGQNIDLQFKVSQPYDGYQTWAHLDDVRITAATNAATVSSQINLFSHDASGSGVAKILYQIDGGITATYSAPLIIDSGIHVLTYFAKDEAGNNEATKSMTINATESASVDFGVVLNEFLPSGSWVKLYNNNTDSVEINGWQIKNSAGDELAVINGLIPSHGKLKIESVGMNETGDSLILLKSDNTLVDSFTYTFSTPGKSFKREPDGTGTWKDPEVTVEPEIITIASSSATPEPTPAPIQDSVPSPTPVPTVTPTPESVVEPTISPPETSQSIPTTEPTPQVTVAETQN